MRQKLVCGNQNKNYFKYINFESYIILASGHYSLLSQITNKRKLYSLSKLARN